MNRFHCYLIALITWLVFLPSAIAITPVSGYEPIGIDHYQVMTVIDIGNVEVTAISSADEPCVACNSAVSLTNTTYSKTNTNSTETIITSGVSVPIMAYIKPRKLIAYCCDEFDWPKSNLDVSAHAQAKPYAGVLTA